MPPPSDVRAERRQRAVQCRRQFLDNLAYSPLLARLLQLLTLLAKQAEGAG